VRREARGEGRERTDLSISFAAATIHRQIRGPKTK
jgi:hypothetical protein